MAGLRPHTLFCLLTLLPLAPSIAREPGTGELQQRRSELLEMHRRDPVARDALAREIARIDTLLGQIALRESRPEQAINHFRSALLYDDGLEVARVELIVSLLKIEEVHDALSEAFSGVARHPDSADLLTLQGEVLYRLNRLDETVAAWRQALALRPEPGLRERLEQVERELERTESFRTSEAPHFTLQYDGDRLDPDLEEAIVEALEEGYDEFVRTLDHLPEATLTVILYTRQAFQDITEAPTTVGGLFDGKVRLPMGGLSHLSRAARATVRHELAHAFVHGKTRGRTPRWLHEGIAQWLEPRSTGSRAATLAREARRRGLDSEVPFSYANALSQVEYLIDYYGTHELLDVLENLREGMSTDDALRETYRVDTRGLWSEWARWLDRNHPEGGR
jgi:tetratricopeptide (TPR) repeat protein